MMTDNSPVPDQDDIDALKFAQEALTALIKVLNKQPDYWSIADAIVAVQGVVSDMRCNVRWPDYPDDEKFETPAVSMAAQSALDTAAQRKPGAPYRNTLAGAMKSLSLRGMK